jgi:hypothetical protein
MDGNEGGCGSCMACSEQCLLLKIKFGSVIGVKLPELKVTGINFDFLIN